jgi:hypothetical protein
MILPPGIREYRDVAVRRGRIALAVLLERRAEPVHRVRGPELEVRYREPAGQRVAAAAALPPKATRLWDDFRTSHPLDVTQFECGVGLAA